MNNEIRIDELSNFIPVRRTIASLFGNQNIEVIKRSASFIIKLVDECGDKVFRLIVLPPHGYTANSVSKTNSHPEVRWAKITVIGGVRSGKVGYSQIRNAIKFAYFSTRTVRTEGIEPYASIDFINPFYREIIKSSKETFFAVRENGEGFYHNLINLTNDWIILELEKFLSQRREMNFHTKSLALRSEQQVIFHSLIKAISTLGDEIFEKNSELVEKIINFDIDKILPLLIEGLNFLETGKHEPCSMFALILKIGRKEPMKVINYLNTARALKEAPSYYLDELIQKLTNIMKIKKHTLIFLERHKMGV